MTQQQQDAIVKFEMDVKNTLGWSVADPGIKDILDKLMTHVAQLAKAMTNDS